MSYRRAVLHLRAAGSKQGLLSASLPSGDYTLALTYHTPGMGAGWVAFASAVSLLVLWVGGTLTLRRRRVGWSRTQAW